MLSDEEREVLEILNNTEWDGFMITIKKLIEKQSKEIEEAEQKEKQAYIDGTDVAHELCNKYWEDKIKAKIEEINKEMLNEKNSLELFYRKKYCKEALQSLLEKE